MSYYLQQAQAIKEEFKYLIGTSKQIGREDDTDLIRGIVIVADDGECIYHQMQLAQMQSSLLDDAPLIIKPWVFKYRIYMIHQIGDNPQVLSYQNLEDSLEELDIAFDSRKYEY